MLLDYYGAWYQAYIKRRGGGVWWSRRPRPAAKENDEALLMVQGLL